MRLFRKGVELPSRILILLSIGIVVFLALIPLVTDFVETGKSLRPENLVRPSLREGFETWKENIGEGNEWKNADQTQIWKAYMNTETNFMGGKIKIWRICQFGLQEEGEDFTFKHCWNYAVKNYLDENELEKGESKEDYKLVAVDCPRCWNNKEREYIYRKKFSEQGIYVPESQSENIRGTYVCRTKKDGSTNVGCTKEPFY